MTRKNSSAISLSRADADWLSRLDHADRRPVIPPVRQQMETNRARLLAEAADAAGRTERRAAAVSATDEHEYAMDQLRRQEQRLPGSSSRPGPERITNPKPDVCSHGMERMNCALCNRGRFPAPIKLRR